MSEIRALPAIGSIIFSVVLTTILFTHYFSWQRSLLDAFFTFTFFILIGYVGIYALSNKYYKPASVIKKPAPSRKKK